MSAPARYATARSGRATRGRQVAVLAAAKGKPLMPWQAQVVDVALEIDPETGTYFYDTVIVTVPRQSGKTKLVGDVADHRCIEKAGARVWYGAQTGKDASAWMRDEHHPSLAIAAVLAGQYRTRCSAGQESVIWGNGSSFRVFPPQRDALHGKQVDLAFLDEIWAHDADRGAILKQAVRPAMATRIGAQLWLFSTQGDDSSAMLSDYVEMGRNSLHDPQTRVAYFEWSIAEDADPEDLDVVAAAHPAIGLTIRMEALQVARADFGTDVSGWARAYGNRPTHTRVAAFPPEVWQAAGQEQSADLPLRMGIAYDVTPSGDRTSVAAVWRDKEGTVWAEVIRDEKGTEWAPQFLADLSTKYKVPIGYDTVGVQTLAVADEIARKHKRIKLRGLTSVEFATSCATFGGVVLDGRFRHSRQRALDDAVKFASRRPILDGGWAWGRKVSSAGSIAALVAVTVALRQFDDMPKARILTVQTA